MSQRPFFSRFQFQKVPFNSMAVSPWIFFCLKRSQIVRKSPKQFFSPCSDCQNLSRPTSNFELKRDLWLRVKTPDRTNMRWREAAVGLRFGSLATSTPRAGVCLCLCVRARTGQENNESKGNQKDIKYGTYKTSDAASNASDDL